MNISEVPSLSSQDIVHFTKEGKLVYYEGNFDAFRLSALNLGLYGDNGKENGIYYNGLYRDYRGYIVYIGIIGIIWFII